MFKSLIEQSRTMAKVYTGMIIHPDIRSYFETVVDANHNFGAALAVASEKFLGEIKELAPNKAK